VVLIGLLILRQDSKSLFESQLSELNPEQVSARQELERISGGSIDTHTFRSIDAMIDHFSGTIGGDLQSIDTLAVARERRLKRYNYPNFDLPFNSGLGSYNNGIFTRFRDFPAEIRCMIWKLCSRSKGQKFKIVFEQDGPAPYSPWHSQIPITFHICQESRSETHINFLELDLSLYRQSLGLGSAKNGKAYFNPRVDTLCINLAGDGSPTVRNIVLVQSLGREILEKLQFLQLDDMRWSPITHDTIKGWDWPHDVPLPLHDLVDYQADDIPPAAECAWRTFTGLRGLTLHAYHWMDWDQAGWENQCAVAIRKHFERRQGVDPNLKIPDVMVVECDEPEEEAEEFG
jgi:hypothetical protein